MRRVLILCALVALWAVPVAAQPTFVAVGTTGDGTADVTPGLPTGWAQNDIFLLVVASANEAVTCPAGYAAVTNSPQGVGTAGTFGGTRVTVCWKRAGASESAPTVTDSGDHTYAVIAAFRGCVTSGDPWDITAGSTASEGDLSIPGATTTVANTRVVLVAAMDSNGNLTSSWTNADLGTIADPEHFNAGTANGTDSSLTITSAVKATAGAYTTTTAVTSGGVANRASMSIALKPAVAATTVPSLLLLGVGGDW